MRFLALIAVAAAIGCSDPLAPGDTLIGRWAGTEHLLEATDHDATVRFRCFTVQSGPLVLTDSLTFSAAGIVTIAGGAIQLRVGDPFTIVGRVVVHDVLIDQDMMRPGGGGIPVCNA